MFSNSVTTKTFQILPDPGWIWLDLADSKHNYIKEVNQSDAFFVGHSLGTCEFWGDWELINIPYINFILVGVNSIF